MNSQSLILQLISVSLLLSVPLVSPALQPAPGCPTKCGNVDVPFPFGTRPDCSLDDSFHVICNTSFNPPILYDRDAPEEALEILEISLDGQMKVGSLMAYGCFDKKWLPMDYQLYAPKFVISATRNKFVAVGCDTYAFIEGSEEKNYFTGCTAMCDKIDRVENGTCSGIGCCQMSFPKGVKGFRLSVHTYGNHTLVKDFNNCGYAFVIEQGSYHFSSSDLMGLRKRINDYFPVGLDWSVGNLTCEEAQKNDSSAYACRAINSECYNPSNGIGYNCKCLPGFQGNPYLVNGCRGTN